jgi:zinc/manganese transport system substrate-binding protein
MIHSRISFVCFFALSLFTPLLSKAAVIKIISLHSIITEIAQDVGGNKVTVIALIKTDVDPHTFEPTAYDLKYVESANLILASGLGMESYLSKLVQNTNTHSELIALGDLTNLKTSESNKKNPDPHWWQSIDCVIDATNSVADALIRLNPMNAGYFKANAVLKIAQLNELKLWSLNEISKLPLNKRELVTSHDAFTRFADDFKFRVHSIAGLSPESEPNARDIALLIDFIKREKIKTIFIENRINPKITEGIISDTGVRLGAVLYSDGLGSTECQTYISMYKNNVRAIVNGLK